MKKHLKPARTLAIVAAILGVSALAISLHLKSLAAAARFAPTATELATALTRVGLTPDALTAVGISPNDTEQVVGAALAWLVEEQTALGSADQAFASAKRTHDHLLRRVRSGRASELELQDLQQAQSGLATARVQRQSLLDALYDAATEALSAPQRATLSRIRQNRSWKLPTEFLTVDREQGEWVSLRDALANERISAEWGQDPDAAAQTLLAQLRADPAVSAARANLDVNLDLITSTWQNEVGS